MSDSYIKRRSCRFVALLTAFIAVHGPLMGVLPGENDETRISHNKGLTRINAGSLPVYSLDDRSFEKYTPAGVESDAVGNTRVFWVHNFQFFSGDYRLGATLQHIGEHAYYYVENADVLSSAVDEANSIIYVGTTHAGVFKRQFSDAVWTDISTGLPTDNTRNGYSAVNALVLTDAGTLIAGTDHGLFAREPANDSWKNRGGISTTVFDLLASEATIYAAMGGYIWSDDSDGDGDIDVQMGVRVSIDDGSAWSNLSAGLPKDEDGETIEVLSLAEARDTVWAATPGGLFSLPAGEAYWEGGMRSLDISAPDVTVKLSDSERDEAEMGGEFFRAYYRWLTVDPAEVFPETELTVTLHNIPDGLASEGDTISQWLCPLTPGILGDKDRLQLVLSSITASYNVSSFFSEYDTLADGSVSMPIANMCYQDVNSVATIIDPLTEVMLLLEDAEDPSYEIGGQFATVTYDNGDDVYRWSAKIVLLREPNKEKRGVIIRNSRKIFGGAPDYSFLNLPDQLEHFSATTIDNQYLFSELASSADGDTLYGLSGDVHTIMEHEGRVYIGTSSGVLYFDESTSDWKRLPYLLPYTPVAVKSLKAVGGTLYAGGEFGLFGFRTSDSTWVADNQGLYAYITSDEIDQLVEYTDARTPADTSKGIYDVITSAFGADNLPDVDGSDTLTILLHDVHDISEAWTSTSNGSEGGIDHIQGYIRPVDQSTVGRTNIRDLLYLTTKAADTEERAAALAHQLVNLMMLNNDIDEERWITEGVAFLGEKLCGFDLPATWADFAQEATTGITLISGSPGAAWAVSPDGGSAKAELYTKVAMWMTYLYENLGGMPFIKALMTEPTNGIAGIDSLLPTFKPAGVDSLTFSDVFSAWAIANAVNDSTLTNPVTHLRYGYIDSLFAATINVFRAKSTDGIGVKAIPLMAGNSLVDYSKIIQPPLYLDGLNNWATVYRSFFHLPSTGGPKAWAGLTYHFNAADHNTVRVWIVKHDRSGTFVVKDLTDSLNSQNEITFNILDEFQPNNADSTEFDFDVLLVGLSNQTSRGGSARIVQSTDMDPPEVELSFLHHAAYPEFVSIFLMSHEHIHTDVHLAESPVVMATRGYVTNQIPMTVFYNFTNKYLKPEGTIYEGKLQLDFGDTLLIELESLQDLPGNDTTYVPVPIVINKVINPGEPIVFSSYDGEMTVSLPADAVRKSTYLTAYREAPTLFGQLNGVAPERLEPVLGIYTVGPCGLALDNPGELRITFDAEPTSEKAIGLYLMDNQGFIPIPSTYDPKAKRLNAMIDMLGTYVLSKDADLPADLQVLPDRYELAQNHPNPFNPSTAIHYSLPEAGWTKVLVYDLLGREVTTLIDRFHEPGYYQTVWDGNDLWGRKAGAGIYFCRIQSGGFSATRKMILIK